MISSRVVIITGGRRIGRVVAQELAARGADIVLSYRGSKAEAEQGVADAVAQGRRAVALQADVSKAADCAALVAGAVKALGRIDVVVNMASVYGSKPFDKLTEAAWDRNLSINLKSAFLCGRRRPGDARAAAGRTHRQLRRLAGAQRPPALHAASSPTTWPRPASSR